MTLYSPPQHHHHYQVQVPFVESDPTTDDSAHPANTASSVWDMCGFITYLYNY